MPSGTTGAAVAWVHEVADVEGNETFFGAEVEAADDVDKDDEGAEGA